MWPHGSRGVERGKPVAGGGGRAGRQVVFRIVRGPGRQVGDVWRHRSSGGGGSWLGQANASLRAAAAMIGAGHAGAAQVWRAVWVCWQRPPACVAHHPAPSTCNHHCAQAAAAAAPAAADTAGGWKEYTAPDGRKYFYNKVGDCVAGWVGHLSCLEAACIAVKPLQLLCGAWSHCFASASAASHALPATTT